MTTNELKKGCRIRLENGWEATIEDNKKGNIRMATVEGFVTEMGSIYSHDIKSYQDSDGVWYSDLSYTKSQEKCLSIQALF